MEALRALSWLRLVLFTAGVLLFSSSARTMPFSVTGTLEGSRGDSVELVLVDANVVDLEAAGIKFSFDPLSLTLTEILTGDITSGFFLFAGPPSAGSPSEVLVSLASFLGPMTGVSGSLLIARFDINATAALGQTAVVFESFDPDYEVTATTGLVTISGSTVPEAGTLQLVVLGLGWLTAVAVRRRRRSCEKDYLGEGARSSVHTA